MPLIRIDASQARRADDLAAMGDTVHRAMVETLGAPADDKFQVMTRRGAGELNITPSYLGISHGDDVIIIQVTLNQGRSVEQKRSFYRRLADELHAAHGLRREDVIVSLVEVAKENWSFGNGEAQYAT